MRTITDVTGKRSLWHENKPVANKPPADRPDKAETMDGKRERVELNSRGYRGKLGRLVDVVDNGPRIRATIYGMASGKATKAWPAMSRARSGKLMSSALDNPVAEFVLWRGRHLFDLATVGHDILPFVSKKANSAAHQAVFYATRIDTSVSDLNLRLKETEGTGFQGPDYKMRIGPRYAPSIEKLAAMTLAQYNYWRKKMPTLHEVRYIAPRGSRKLKRDEELRWAGKVTCKSGAPPHNPYHDEADHHIKLDAQDQLELLRELMTGFLFEIFFAMASSSATNVEIGEAAGFNGKQAEAVGLDRSRMAIAAAISAFEYIDSLEEAEPATKPYPLRPPISLIKNLPDERLAA